MSEETEDINIVALPRSISGVHRFCHEAMATVFEIFVLHEDGRYAAQAAQAAFDELDRIEGELSRFIENSDISRINNLAANQPLQIGLDAFECLRLSMRMYEETDGAFDVTLGTGGDHGLLQLDEASHMVESGADSVQIDLGGIGKGYAVDRMAELLGQWSIDTALIHGGFSSVLAVGRPAGSRGWPVTLSNPANHSETLAKLYLCDRAMGASGLQKGTHIIDTRDGRVEPVEGKAAAWAMAPGAGMADGLSTAFMVMGPKQVMQYCQKYSDVSAMVVLQEQGKVLRYGSW